MAKRFGRNQRRKMREQIAGLEALAEFQSKAAEQAVSEAAHLRRRLHDWANELRHLLNDYSAFHEVVRKIECEDIRAMDGRLRLQPLPPIKAHMPTRADTMPFFGSVSTVIEACIYIAAIDQSARARMNNEVRVVLRSRNGDLAYAMNAERHHAWTPRDVAYISEMIGQQMSQYAAHKHAADQEPVNPEALT